MKYVFSRKKIPIHRRIKVRVIGKTDELRVKTRWIILLIFCNNFINILTLLINQFNRRCIEHVRDIALKLNSAFENVKKKLITLLRRFKLLNLKNVEILYMFTYLFLLLIMHLPFLSIICRLEMFIVNGDTINSLMTNFVFFFAVLPGVRFGVRNHGQGRRRFFGSWVF